MLSPRTINEAAVVSNYFNLDRIQNGDQRLPQTYGLVINELYGNEDQIYGIPAINIAGYTGLSGARDTRDHFPVVRRTGRSSIGPGDDQPLVLESQVGGGALGHAFARAKEIGAPFVL